MSNKISPGRSALPISPMIATDAPEKVSSAKTQASRAPFALGDGHL